MTQRPLVLAAAIVTTVLGLATAAPALARPAASADGLAQPVVQLVPAGPAALHAGPAALQPVNYVWVPGHWEWRRHGHVWVPGAWILTRPGQRGGYGYHGGHGYRGHGYGNGHYRDGHGYRDPRWQPRGHGWNHRPRDRDRDGIPDRHDRRPGNPRRS